MKKNKKDLLKTAFTALVLAASLPATGQAGDEPTGNEAGQSEVLLASAGCGGGSSRGGYPSSSGCGAARGGNQNQWAGCNAATNGYRTSSNYDNTQRRAYNPSTSTYSTSTSTYDTDSSNYAQPSYDNTNRSYSTTGQPWNAPNRNDRSWDSSNPNQTMQDSSYGTTGTNRGYSSWSTTSEDEDANTLRTSRPYNTNNQNRR